MARTSSPDHTGRLYPTYRRRPISHGRLKTYTSVLRGAQRDALFCGARLVRGPTLLCGPRMGAIGGWELRKDQGPYSFAHPEVARIPSNPMDLDGYPAFHSLDITGAAQLRRKPARIPHPDQTSHRTTRCRRANRIKPTESPGGPASDRELDQVGLPLKRRSVYSSVLTQEDSHPLGFGRSQITACRPCESLTGASSSVDYSRAPLDSVNPGETPDAAQSVAIQDQAEAQPPGDSPMPPESVDRTESRPSATDESVIEQPGHRPIGAAASWPPNDDSSNEYDASPRRDAIAPRDSRRSDREPESEQADA